MASSSLNISMLQVSHLSEFTQRTVRDKFARLTQMSTVLSLETPSEILDYWVCPLGPFSSLRLLISSS